MAPSGVERVDAQDQLARGIPARRQRRRYGGPGVLLRLRRDRVLEIENQAIGRQGTRLFEGAGVGTGHEQHGTARAGQSAHRKPRFSGLSAHIIRA